MMERSLIRDKIRRLDWLRKEKKQLEVEEQSLKTDLREPATERFIGNEQLLPVQTLEVPAAFWLKTGMDYDSFLDTRFPTWDCEHFEEDKPDTGDVTFVLRKKPEFMGWEFDADGTTLKYSPVEPTPDIDWDSLRRELPELYKTLAEEVITYKINEEAFEKIVRDQPESLVALQRHTRAVRAPSQKFTTKVKGGSGDES